MSWPMQNSGQWNPGPPMGMPMGPDMNMGSYTADQWAAMQQQNWQQWTQWQQQYAQWQSQYGEKYAEQMQAIQAMGGMPPLPPANTAPPPAPPPPEKPPPPPHENNQPLYGHTPIQPTPVPAPNQEKNSGNNIVINTHTQSNNHSNWSHNQESSVSAVNAEALKKLAEEERLFDIQFTKWEEEIQKWKKDNVNHPDKQAYQEYEEKFESCRAQLLERRQQMNKKKARLLGTAPPPPPPLQQPGTSKIAANVSKPAPPAANIPTNAYSNNQHQNYANSNMNNNPNLNNVHQNYGPNYNPNPTQSYGNNSTQKYSDQVNTQYQQYNVPQNTFSNNKQVNIQERFDSYSNNEKKDNSFPSKPFLLASESNKKGIPGLDLVPDVEKNYGKNVKQDVIDITGEKPPQSLLTSKGPDYSTISKGINNILGDEKIMNILSMVRGQVEQAESKNKGNQANQNEYVGGNQSNPSYEQGYRNQNYNKHIENRPSNPPYQQQDNNFQNQDGYPPNRIKSQNEMEQDSYNTYDRNTPFKGNEMGLTYDSNSNSRGIPPLMRPNMPGIRPPMRPLLPSISAEQNDYNRGPPGFQQDANNYPRGVNHAQQNMNVYSRAPPNFNQQNINEYPRGPSGHEQNVNDYSRGPPGPPQQNVNDYSRGPPGPPQQNTNDYSRGPPSLQQNVNDFNRGPQAQRLSNDYSRGNLGPPEPVERRPLLENNISQPARPKWVDEPMFSPSLIVEYEHKPLRLKARDFIEPVHMFEYNHKSKDDDLRKKDYEKEPDDLYIKKARRLDKEFDYAGDRYGHDYYSRDYERRPPRDDLRDEINSRGAIRDDYGDKRRLEDERRRTDDDRRRIDDDRRRLDDDRRRPDVRYDDRRRDDRDKYSRREDPAYRERDRDFHRDRGRDTRREDTRHRSSRERDNRKRELSKDSEISDPYSKRSRENDVPAAQFDKPSHVVMIDDLLEPPGREIRPDKIVIILRGPPGSGKSFLAKLIRDREAEHGGTVRIMSIDDYFMQEGEVEEKDPNTGKMIKKPTLKYEYEESSEETYINSLKRAFKRSLTDGYFTFIIYDAVNDTRKSYADVWNLCRQNDFQAYVCTMELDPQTCYKRNIHNRKLGDIEAICARFYPTPTHHIQLNATTLLQSGAITEVDMEDAVDDVIMEDAQENEVESVFTSKWEKMDDAAQLARLDGTSRPLRSSQLSMEDYLQLDDWKPTASKPGKKTVRWADIEERRQQEKMRAIGFVVGQTDWNRMTDPTMGSSALTQTKYIERVRRH